MSRPPQRYIILKQADRAYSRATDESFIAQRFQPVPQLQKAEGRASVYNQAFMSTQNYASGLIKRKPDTYKI